MSNISSIDFSAVQTGQERIPSKTLTQDDFFQVMVAELSQQDPFNAVDASSFMDQFVSMNNLESLQNISSGMDTLNERQSSLLAQNLIGSNVEVKDGPNSSRIGIVEGSRIDGEEVFLSISGVEYPSSSVVAVLAGNQVNL